MSAPELAELLFNAFWDPLTARGWPRPSSWIGLHETQREAWRQVAVAASVGLADQIADAAKARLILEKHWSLTTGASLEEHAIRIMDRLRHDHDEKCFVVVQNMRDARAERDKLQRELDAIRTVPTATERTVDSGNEAFRTLREQWQGDRAILQAKCDALIQERDAALEQAATERQRYDEERAANVALGVERDKLWTELEVERREVEHWSRRTAVALAKACPAQSNECAIRSRCTNKCGQLDAELDRADAYRARNKAEQCSRCGRPESPTCCAVPPTRKL